MTVAFRADADVTNGAAGTSVVVARPSGTTNGDVLIAIVGATGVPTVTAPAGWTLIGTQDASTSVRIAAYRKVASTEPASWTWTLGSSQRNWGWVGTYTGVDTTGPILDWAGVADVTAGTGFFAGSADLTTGAVGVAAVAAVRTASGAATTWAPSGTERADVSTNGGAGTDIGGAVTETTYTGLPAASYAPTFTASQSCTAGAILTITLRAAFVGYDGDDVPEAIVEVAWGADPDGDPDLWDWTDISTAVKANPGIVITRGLQPDSRAPMAPPTSLALTLLNPDGDFTPDNPLGANWPYVVADTPIRVSVPYGYAPPTERCVVFAESWDPTWDTSTADAVVELTAYGRLHRMQTLNTPVESALRRALSGVLPESTSRAHAYWPCEDKVDARRIASAFAQPPADATLGVNFASASDCPGSDALPTLDAGSYIFGLVPAYATTTQWVALAVVKMPETPPVSTVRILQAQGTGSAPLWWLELVPGSPDTLHVRAYVDNDTSILDASVSIVEADVYGQWVLAYIAVTQDGSAIDYTGGYLAADAGVSQSGTLASRTIGRAVRITGQATAASDGIATGHLAVITDPSYDYATSLPVIAFTALDGNTGDQPHFRFQDLCLIANVPYDFDADVDIPALTMGPLLPTTLPSALEECAATDQGTIHDAGPGGSLIFVTRSSRYNAPVALTLDVDERELAPPFGPQYTTRDRVSDSTVARSGGSSARYVDTSIRGARAEQVNYSLDDDHHLEQIAGYRVRLSSTPGMRYPSLAINLRQSPELLPQWLDCRIGSRVQVNNLWRGHGPAVIDQHADGSVERISDRWDVTLHCNPAQRFDVPVLESSDDSAFRADCEATALVTLASDSATNLLVTSAAALVTTNPADYPVDIDVGGEQITATATADSVTDTFGGSSASGWTPSDTGQVWTHPFGAASDYTEGGGDGDMVLAAADAFRGSVLDVGSPYADWTADLSLSVGSAAAASITLWVCTGWLDTSNYNVARLTLSTGGVMSLGLLRRNAGTLTTVTSPITGTSNTASDRWRVTMRASATALVASMRNVTTGAAATSVVGSADGLAVGTGVAILARRELGNTNAGLLVTVDNVAVRNPQTISVSRGQYSRAQAAGTSVRLWRGRGVAL